MSKGFSVEQFRAHFAVVMRENGFTFRQIGAVFHTTRGRELFIKGARMVNEQRRRHGLPPRYPEFVWSFERDKWPAGVLPAHITSSQFASANSLTVPPEGRTVPASGANKPDDLSAAESSPGAHKVSP